jgi:hypothetical protein
MADAGIQIKRHFRKLSAKDMDEVVDIAADLIVRHLKGRPKPEKPQAQEKETRS